jgi:hypothetical protein
MLDTAFRSSHRLIDHSLRLIDRGAFKGHKVTLGVDPVKHHPHEFNSNPDNRVTGRSVTCVVNLTPELTLTRVGESSCASSATRRPRRAKRALLT